MIQALNQNVSSEAIKQNDDDFVLVSKYRLLNSDDLRKEFCDVVHMYSANCMKDTMLNEEDFWTNTFSIYSKIIERVNIEYCGAFVAKAKSNNTSRNKAIMSDTEAFRTALKVQAKKNAK